MSQVRFMNCLIVIKLFLCRHINQVDMPKLEGVEADMTSWPTSAVGGQLLIGQLIGSSQWAAVDGQLRKPWLASLLILVALYMMSRAGMRCCANIKKAGLRHMGSDFTTPTSAFVHHLSQAHSKLAQTHRTMSCTRNNNMGAGGSSHGAAPEWPCTCPG